MSNFSNLINEAFERTDLVGALHYFYEQGFDEHDIAVTLFIYILFSAQKEEIKWV